MPTPRSLVAPLIGSFLLGACADAAIVTGPDPVDGPVVVPRFSSEYDGSVPFVEGSEIPDKWRPRILDIVPQLQWQGRVVAHSGRVEFIGNRIGGTVSLAITGPLGSTTTTASSSNVYFFPDLRLHPLPSFSLAALGDCGHVANAMASYTATTTIFFKIGGLTSFSAGKSNGTNAIQPDCKQEEKDAPAEKPSGEGGGSSGGDLDGCPECLEAPTTGYTTCRVRYWYYVDTGEIFDYQILYCW